MGEGGNGGNGGDSRGGCGGADEQNNSANSFLETDCLESVRLRMVTFGDRPFPKNIVFYKSGACDQGMLRSSSERDIVMRHPMSRYTDITLDYLGWPDLLLRAENKAKPPDAEHISR